MTGHVSISPQIRLSIVKQGGGFGKGRACPGLVYIQIPAGVLRGQKEESLRARNLKTTKQDGRWRIGRIQEITGVNCRETGYGGLLKS